VRPRQLAAGGVHRAALPHLHHLPGPGGKLAHFAPFKYD
jgi:hypothetical protein